MSDTQGARTFMGSDRQAAILDRTLLRWFWPFAAPFRVRMAWTFVMLLACEVIPFLFPSLLQGIIDGPVAQKNPGGVWPWALAYLGLVVAHAALVFGKTWFTQKIGIEVIHNLRIHVFRHLQSLDTAYFQRTPAGRLMTRVTHDVDTLQALFTDGLIDLVSSVLMLGFAITFMLVKDWRLGLTSLLFLPLLFGATAIFRVKMRHINGLIRQELAGLNSSLQENLNGMPLVQLFRKQSKRYAYYAQRNLEYKQATHHQARYYSWFFPSINTISDFSLLACYTMGMWLITRGEITAGTLAAFTWLASIFNRPLREISDKITNLQTALAAGERVFSLAQIKPELPAGTRTLPAGGLDVEFSHVDFSYRDDQPVLHDVTFRVATGTTTALVGSTGSGKSTIVNLLNRFYLPAKGCIALGGVPLSDVQNEILHQRIATVSQDVFLFSGTLRDNILLGARFKEEHFQETCARTRVTVIADRLPEGYDTLLREGGKGLSAGERQLVSFARALYAEPDILLLDEATANIDTPTELLVQQALQELTRGRTSVVVAHRLSTIAGAEQILVIQEGRIVERGTHADLVAQKGHYQKLLG